MSRREPPQHGDVEPLAVVRDEDVVADERPKLGPDLGERALAPHGLVSVPVDLRGTRGNRSIRLDQPVEPIDDLPLDHPGGPDLHDLAELCVLVGRLEIERNVALERGIERLAVQQLECLE